MGLTPDSAWAAAQLKFPSSRQAGGAAGGSASYAAGEMKKDGTISKGTDRAGEGGVRGGGARQVEVRGDPQPIRRDGQMLWVRH